MVLKAKQIEHASEGMRADGQGLYLRVQASGSKSWIYRYQIAGKRREMGVGTLTDRPAPDARAEAALLRAQVKAGIDPIDARLQRAELAAAIARQVEVRATTFDDVAADYIASHREAWKNAKHAAQWENTLATYARPVIGAKPVTDVNTDDVLVILRPIWSTKTETASRVRSRLELILSYAKAKKLRQGENPATWRGHLDALLPKPTKVTKIRHHPALPIDKMPAFMAALHVVAGSGARALEFAILTAARSGEVRLMGPAEVDLDSKIWTIPAARMKAGREHRVPLSDAAIKVFLAAPKLDGNPYQFPGAKKGQPLSDMSLSAVTKRMNKDKEPMPWVDSTNGAQVVPHGFRSTFRDWAAECTNFPRDMAEMALAHSVGDKVEAAYRRGDMLTKRFEMMAEWADWCGSAPSD